MMTTNNNWKKLDHDIIMSGEPIAMFLMGTTYLHEQAVETEQSSLGIES